jgi:hypothetical protein
MGFLPILTRGVRIRFNANTRWWARLRQRLVERATRLRHRSCSGGL